MPPPPPRLHSSGARDGGGGAGPWPSTELHKGHGNENFCSVFVRLFDAENIGRNLPFLSDPSLGPSLLQGGGGYATTMNTGDDMHNSCTNTFWCSTDLREGGGGVPRALQTRYRAYKIV